MLSMIIIVMMIIVMIIINIIIKEKEIYNSKWRRYVKRKDKKIKKEK